MVLVSAIGRTARWRQYSSSVLDQNMSIIEGSLGVLPRRILVQ